MLRRIVGMAWLIGALVAGSTRFAGAAVQQMPITFGGYSNRTEVLTNFPVLVVLSNTVGGSNSFDYSHFVTTNGWDLRFRDAGDTTNLNYEIELWNTNGASFVWVQVPAIPTNGTGSILAEWGNPSDSSQLACTTNGTVWTAGFKGVWHLRNAGSQADATTNGNRCTTYNGAVATPGMAAGAIAFDGADDYMKTDANIGLSTVQKLTVSCWAKQMTFDNTDKFWMELSANANNAPDGSFFVTPNGSGGGTSLGNGKMTIALYGAGPKYCIAACARPSAGVWHHYAFIFDRTSANPQIKAVYVDGIAQSLTFDTLTPKLAAGTYFRNDILYFMARGGASLYDAGSLDEARLASTLRSSDWVWAEYMNLASNAAFATCGAVQSPAVEGPEIVNVGVTNIQATAAELVGMLRTGAAPVTVECYWGTNNGGYDVSAWMTNTVMGSQPLGSFTNRLTNLVSGQVYSFCYRATNSAGAAWAPYPVTFITSGKPTVDNDSGAASVTTTSARLQGTLLGGGPSPSVWIYWGTAEGNTNSKASWNLPPFFIGQPAFGTFGADADGLLANQLYWYRCYASNENGEAWAPASTNFTTPAPTLTLTPASVGILEAALGTTTTVVYAASLSATSAVAVTVDYATSNGTATAGSDYTASSGMLSIPAGVVTGAIFAAVIGDNVYESNETFFINLSNVVHATLGTNQVSCTISNDDFTLYVRPGGAGVTNGSDWANAYDTVQRALTAAPGASGTRDDISSSVPIRICVEASTGAQSYDVAARSVTSPLDLDFEGGWENVTGVATQTGISVVQDLDGTIDEAGLSLPGAGAYQWRRVVVNRFAFTNVTRGVEVITGTAGGSKDKADIFLTVSNTTVCAKNDGIYITYQHAYGVLSWGGKAKLTAGSVAIAAGLGGAGYGVYIAGAWQGSSITSDGTNVSTIVNTNGGGIYFTAYNNEMRDASFADTVIYDCASNGVHLDAAMQGGVGGSGSNVVRATFLNCTIADNIGDGVHMVSSAASSYARVTNSILANNGGAGVNLVGPAGVFTCADGFNVFFEDDILTTGVTQVLAASTSTNDPLFYGSKTKPAPWYTLGAKTSPAFYSGSDGRHRGAYQSVTIKPGTLFWLK